MKNKLILTTLLFTALISAQELTFEPLFKVGIYSGKCQTIVPNSGFVVIDQTVNKTFEYYTTIGGRVKYKSFSLESKNKISIATNDFINNNPYNVEFYLKAYYGRDKIKIGVEHLCVHPIECNDVGMTYNIRGGHNEVFFSYNFN